jgi:hypothetical protein
MRNYLKFRALHFTGHGTLVFNPDLTHEFFIIERDQAAVDAKKAYLIQYTLDHAGGYTWTFEYPRQPFDFYFLLNYDKILQLLSEQAGFFFTFYVTEPGYNDAPGYAANCKLGDSPRSDFPTTLGTDGQRLRGNKSASSGAALNYIGKLYFLTSNPDFKVLFDSLKAGKISVREALAAANLLAESR